MKLDDIKKLKVPELRFKLKELGLEAKGLKAELVTRLWSASEAGKSQDVEGNFKQNDSVIGDGVLVLRAIPPDAFEPSAAPLEEEAGPSPEADRCKEFTDSATQTETPDTGPNHPRLTPAGVCEAPAGQRQAGFRQGDEEECRESGGAQPCEERGRGRAFYEFKEEIRYKR